MSNDNTSGDDQSKQTRELADPVGAASTHHEVAMLERSTPKNNDDSVERLGGWLVIGGALGSGGQGEVVRVRHTKTGEMGALKRMAGKRALTDKGQERFRREIEAFRRVKHPFVVRILDAGESPEPFLVTELAALGSLHDNREAFYGDAWRALRMIRSIALGLAAAHGQTIVHRDIKPKNILLQSLDHPLVADFGIAHFADKDTVTSIGSHPGAFKFAPPEYEFDEEPTPAFDVFSLGAVLHFSIFGDGLTRPYRVLNQLPPVGGIGATVNRFRAVDDLIGRMTKKNPSERFQTMAEVADAAGAVIERLFGQVALEGKNREMASALPIGIQRDTGTNEYVWEGPDGLAIKMVWVPSGLAVIGQKSETVRADVGFYLARHPTTVGEFKRFVAAMAMQGKGVRKWSPPNFAQDDTHPVVNVTWYEAAAYCKWAGLRLPTDFEWEYAARGSVDRMFPWGNETPTDERLWWSGSTPRTGTCPVGQFPNGSSPFGVLDMAGNVWEWVQDVWNLFVSLDHDTNGSRAREVTDESMQMRVLRGGGWHSSKTTGVRAFVRRKFEPNHRNAELGFRCALGPIHETGRLLHPTISPLTR